MDAFVDKWASQLPQLPSINLSSVLGGAGDGASDAGGAEDAVQAASSASSSCASASLLQRSRAVLESISPPNTSLIAGSAVVVSALAAAWYCLAKSPQKNRNDSKGETRHHPIFLRYPLSACKDLGGVGLVPVPYHAYESRVVSMHGFCDLEAAEELVKGDGVSPVPCRPPSAQNSTSSGRGLLDGCWAAMTIQISDVVDSTLGPHTEVLFLLHVNRAYPGPPPSTPSAPLPATWGTLVNLWGSGSGRLCISSWQSTQRSGAYAAAVLGQDVRLTTSRFSQEAQGGASEFSFGTTTSSGSGGGAGGMLLSGRISRAPSLIRWVCSGGLSLWANARGWGWGRIRKGKGGEEGGWRGGQVMTQQRDAGSEVRPNSEGLVYDVVDGRCLRFVGPGDVLIWGEEMSHLGFQCLFVEQSACRRVRLGLHNAGDRMLREKDLLGAIGWEDVASPS